MVEVVSVAIVETVAAVAVKTTTVIQIEAREIIQILPQQTVPRTNKVVRNHIRKALRPPRMSQLTRAPVTGRKVGRRPTVVTP